MEQNFIDIEGVQVDTEVLQFLLLGGVIKANEELNLPIIPEKRKTFLSTCMESATEIMNRLEEINNPKL